MQESDKVDYALLKVIVAYLEYHMYLTLDVQMETTLAAGEEQLLRFQQLLEVSVTLQSYSSSLMDPNYIDIRSTSYYKATTWPKTGIFQKLT